LEQTQFGITSYKKDAYITVEGRQKAEYFFIVQSGWVRISREISVTGYGDELIMEGDVFGFVSAMSSNNYIETAVAETDVVLITIRPQNYEQVIKNNSHIAMKILLQLCKRLRNIGDELTIKTVTGDDEPVSLECDFSRMFEAGEYFFVNKKYAQASYVYNKYLEHCPSGPKSVTVKTRLANMTGQAENATTEYKAGDLNREYNKGDLLFVEGEPGEELFIIQKGSVEVVKIVAGKEMLLGLLKAGDIFGELSLLDGNPRNASAIAAEPCSIMAVNKAGFKLLTEERPHMIYRISSLIADRIWLNIRRLDNSLIRDPLGRVYGLLLIYLVKERVSFQSTRSYRFPLSWDDLSHMLGFEEKESFIHMGELQKKDRNIHITQGIIDVDSIKDLVKTAEYYQKIHEMEDAKKHRSSM